jgi:hypothetical protein
MRIEEDFALLGGPRSEDAFNAFKLIDAVSPQERILKGMYLEYLKRSLRICQCGFYLHALIR